VEGGQGPNWGWEEKARRGNKLIKKRKKGGENGERRLIIHKFTAK
jgi:hypothetical protein